MRIPFLAVSLSFALLAPSGAEVFGGIDFPQGAVSFADHVVSYEPSFSGGNIPTHPDFSTPDKALGPPDYSGGDAGTGAVSLGSGGRITLRFVNNKLTGSNTAAPDLHIFEIGSQVEATAVEISADGVTWHPVGSVSGSTSSVDIDAFGFGSTSEFSYVRLTDNPASGGTTGPTVGADIDAVGAIAAVSVVDTPQLAIETAIMLKFQSLPGSTYTIESSADMVNWDDTITNIQGNGSILKFFFEITTPRRFYQLKPPAD